MIDSAIGRLTWTIFKFSQSDSRVLRIPTLRTCRNSTYSGLFFFLFFRPSCLSPTGAWIIKRKYCRPPLAHTFISRLSSVEPNTSLRIRVCLQRNVVLNMQRNRVSHPDRFRSSRYTRTVSTIYTHLSAKSIRDDGRQSHRREGRTSVERFLIFVRPEIRAERGIEWTIPDIL